jgi:DNA-binding NarL/FixJ family response regulator
MPQRPAIVELHRSSSAGVRILLADDHDAWRVRIRSFLQRETAWTIVSEASDGLEAVHMAEELHPDIIILDLYMPRLNGIEAAKMIRRRSPFSKIIFLTLDGDESVIAAALEAGAAGYVLKHKMVRGLIPAIRASLWAKP